jgi:TolA-binding protein
MGRAIGIAFLLVLLSIGFVLLQLSTRRSTTAPPAPHRQQMFVTRDDGSVYSVSLQLTQFEKRLVEEEERSRSLLHEVETLRKERETLGTQVEQLDDELRRLRRQVNAPPPANAPAGTGEPSATPGSGTPGSSDGTGGTSTVPPGG